MTGPLDENRLRELFAEVQAPSSLDVVTRRVAAPRPARLVRAPLWIAAGALAAVVAVAAVVVPRWGHEEPADKSTTRPQETTVPAPSPTLGPPASNSPSPTASPSPSASSPPSTVPAPNGDVIGVPAGTNLTVHTGDLRVTRAGQVVENLRVDGNVIVTASNVTLRRVKVVADDEFAVAQGEGVTNLTIENSDISARPGVRHGVTQDGTGLTLRNTVIHDVELAVAAGPRLTIVNCHIHGLTSRESSYGVFSGGGDHDMVIRDSVIDNPRGGAAIALYTDDGPHANVLITRNRLAGGNYTVYAPRDGRDVRVVGNRFLRTHHPRSGYYGPVTDWREGNGNQWADNAYDDGSPVTP